MIQLFLLSTLLVTVIGQSTINQNGCGKRPAVETNVVGGTVAATGAHPWLVSMRWNNRHFCGGSLLNNKWILTAAHCVDGRSTANFYSSYSIQMGADNRNTPQPWTHLRNTNLIIKHPAYNKNTFENDVALIRLSEPALIDNQYVVPACIPTTNKNMDGQYLWAAGWGTLASGASTLPEDAYEVELLKTTDADCTSYYSSSYKPFSMICAGEVGDNKDTCQGDSGGPLSWKDTATGLWNVVGITSWGYGCGDIGVYARVSSYYNWIDLTIQSNP